MSPWILQSKRITSFNCPSARVDSPESRRLTAIFPSWNSIVNSSIAANEPKWIYFALLVWDASLISARRQVTNLNSRFGACRLYLHLVTENAIFECMDGYTETLTTLADISIVMQRHILQIPGSLLPCLHYTISWSVEHIIHAATSNIYQISSGRLPARHGTPLLRLSSSLRRDTSST